MNEDVSREEFVALVEEVELLRQALEGITQSVQSIIAASRLMQVQIQKLRENMS